MNISDMMKIQNGIDRYCQLIHTQDEEEFHSLWSSRKVDNILISIGTVYTGSASIYRDFLIGGIRKAYSDIELITKSVEIRGALPDTAIAVFEYETHCIRRDSGEPYGIQGIETQIWVREGTDWKLRHVHYSKRN